MRSLNHNNGNKRNSRQNGYAQQNRLTTLYIWINQYWNGKGNTGDTIYSINTGTRNIILILCMYFVFWAMIVEIWDVYCYCVWWWRRLCENRYVFTFNSLLLLFLKVLTIEIAVWPQFLSHPNIQQIGKRAINSSCCCLVDNQCFQIHHVAAFVEGYHSKVHIDVTKTANPLNKSNNEHMIFGHYYHSHL